MDNIKFVVVSFEKKIKRPIISLGMTYLICCYVVFTLKQNTCNQATVK